MRPLHASQVRVSGLLSHQQASPADILWPVSSNVLSPVVDSFITDVTAALADATRGLQDVDTTRFQADVTSEALMLAIAVIDADERHTDDELDALTATFGPLVEDPQLALLPNDALRDGPILSGGRKWIEADSELFGLLLDADVRNIDSPTPTRFAATYYERTLDVAHVVASLDVIASSATLAAISNLRRRLLHRLGEALPHEFRSVSAVGAGAAGPDGPSSDDSKSPQLDPPRPLEDLLAELDELIGLDEVKARVHRVADLLFVQNLRRERDLPTMEISHHLVFTGNPGTGKTTVARLLAQIYRTLGVVAKGHLVETDRSAMVAGYVGQTAPLVTAKFDEADEGILFIDEAYSLSRGGENDFGREAIDQIVKLMEDRRDRVVLIVAGYPNEMEEFISANPGLRSRFPTTIEFPDYSNEDLLAIVESIGKKNVYELTDKAREKFKDELAAIPRDKGFGNARVARNMFEAAINRQASRIVKLKHPDNSTLTTLEADDIAGPDENPGVDDMGHDHAPDPVTDTDPEVGGPGAADRAAVVESTSAESESAETKSTESESTETESTETESPS